jgi:hypothetical protein
VSTRSTRVAPTDGTPYSTPSAASTPALNFALL